MLRSMECHVERESVHGQRRRPGVSHNDRLSALREDPPQGVLVDAYPGQCPMEIEHYRIRVPEPRDRVLAPPRRHVALVNGWFEAQCGKQLFRDRAVAGPNKEVEVPVGTRLSFVVQPAGYGCALQQQALHSSGGEALQHLRGCRVDAEILGDDPGGAARAIRRLFRQENQNVAKAGKLT